MGAYKYLEEIWRKKQSDVLRFLLRVRAWEYRQGKRCQKVNKPTRTDKAHKLGYKAKQGYCIVRVRVGRGMRKRPHPWGGRKPGKNYAYVQPGKSLQHIAEERDKWTRVIRNAGIKAQ